MLQNDLGLAAMMDLTDRWSWTVSHELALGYERILALGGNYEQAHHTNYGLTGQVWQGR